MPNSCPWIEFSAETGWSFERPLLFSAKTHIGKYSWQVKCRAAWNKNEESTKSVVDEMDTKLSCSPLLNIMAHKDLLFISYCGKRPSPSFSFQLMTFDRWRRWQLLSSHKIPPFNAFSHSSQSSRCIDSLQWRVQSHPSLKTMIEKWMAFVKHLVGSFHTFSIDKPFARYSPHWVEKNVK